MQLVKLSIERLLNYPGNFEGIQIHVLVAGKFIKLNYPNESFIEILLRLKAKGVEDAFVNQQDAAVILEGLQEKLSPKFFYDPTTSEEQKIKQTEMATDHAKQFIKSVGFTKEAFEVLKLSNQRALEMVKDSPNLYTFVRKFKGNCSEEYLKGVLTNLLTGLLIEKFPWKSQQIIQKTMYAGILCDVTLEPQDFEEIYKHEFFQEPISERVRNHPMEVTEIIRKKREIVPMETLTIIEQHHEMPDGKGFPLGLKHSRINQLSAIFIIAQRFVQQLFLYNFDFNQRFKMLSAIQKRYQYGVFNKAIDALVKTVDHG